MVAGGRAVERAWRAIRGKGPEGLRGRAIRICRPSARKAVALFPTASCIAHYLVLGIWHDVCLHSNGHLPLAIMTGQCTQVQNPSLAAVWKAV